MSWFFRNGLSYGYVLTTQVTTIATWSANASGNRLAMRFVARHSGALAGIALQLSSVTGSPQEQNLLVAIHAVSDDGLPGDQLEERELGGATTLTAGRKVITGWTTPLTAGQQYFIVIRNSNASPSTNHFAVAYGVERSTAGDAYSPPFGSFTSTDGGNTWTAQGTQRGNYQIIYNTGTGNFTYDWLVVATNQAVPLNNNPTGVRFTTPNNLRLRVVGVQVPNVAAISSSSWAVRLKQGGNTLGTTLEMPYGIQQWSSLPLASPVTLEANTTTDVELFLVSGTSGSVRCCHPSTALVPMSFGFQAIENGNVVTSRIISLMNLILDPEQPYEVVGGGSGSPIFLPTHRIIT